MSLWHPRFSHTPAAHPGFSSLFRMLDDFDRYAGQHMQLGSTQGSAGGATFSPKFDVTERDKEYELQGELPGVTADEVEIEFTDDQTLVVRGHTERKHEEGDRALLEGGEERKKIEGGAGAGKKEGTAAGKGKEAEGEEGEEMRPKFWLSERSYGEFSRVFTFPAAVDQDKVQAKFKDGVLDIKVPKAEKRGGKKINIQ